MNNDRGKPTHSPTETVLKALYRDRVPLHHSASSLFI